MASEIQIINRAASNLGADRITSRLDESKVAREMDACFDHVRDAELRANTWRFSLARAQLSALSAAPLYQYLYEYQLPTDCLRAVQVGEFYAVSLTDYRGGDESPYSIEGRRILTDLSAPLALRYVRKQTSDDAQFFDALFVELLASRVAIATCEAITGSTSKIESLEKQYKARLAEAWLANALEVPPAAIPDDSWVMARIS